MKWGLIARSETDRGLGIQSLGIYENLKPDKTLLVLDLKSGFESHPENYPDAVHIELEHGQHKNTLNEEIVRDWWYGLDVIFTVETFYDWDVIGWAARDNVRTVVQGNPEFWMRTNPQPDLWTWPTTWRLEHLPPGPVIPVPVYPREVCARDAYDPEPLRALHIAGNRAIGDRNGTDSLALAMYAVPMGVEVTTYAQAPIPGMAHAIHKPAAKNRWDMYKDQHLLVLPRRYGGLCLPALEAMSCGLAVAMSDCSPNTDWPIIPMASDLSRVIRMQTGEVQTHEVPQNIVANTLKHYAVVREALDAAMKRSKQWADDNTWDVHRDKYLRLLDLYA